ncbi:protein of unknown function [Variovorax sp. PDC80]|uniref:DUF4376 domain-containing protein n=1 Tax=Variovorax sp. PDC80 TaxID=1882827 RepID=UPI0008EB6CBC|nr:DUF4376 domain-containing protein [Variovorax sp. PDC80]SFO58678.1 protein of unknown function [Variovorax sp. PDC80]
MPNYTAYDKVTGRVIARGTAHNEEACRMQAAGAHEGILIGDVPGGHYLDPQTLASIPMGEQPTEHCVFDWAMHAWVDPRTLEDRRQALRDQVAEHRWALETGGLVLPDGLRVSTKRSDRDSLSALLVTAERAGIEAVDFKFDSGWVRMSLAELDALACRLALHMQTCFSCERAHHEAIGALCSSAETEAYDWLQGWPLVDLRVPAHPGMLKQSPGSQGSGALNQPNESPAGE